MFKKAITCFAFLVVILTASVFAAEKAGKVTDINFKKLVLEQKGVVVVDFWAPWCGPCNTQGPIVENVANKMENKAKVYKMNVDENSVIAQRFKIRAIPTIMIFKNGKQVYSKEGVHDESTLVQKITNYAK